MFSGLLDCLLDAEEIQKMMDIQVREVELEKPHDYMVGLYNGLALGKSVCDGEEPDLRNVK